MIKVKILFLIYFLNYTVYGWQNEDYEEEEYDDIKYIQQVTITEIINNTITNNNENTIYSTATITNIITDIITSTLTISPSPTCLPNTPDQCSNGCVNLMKDNNNCGKCEYSCSLGQQCLDGICSGCPSNTLCFDDPWNLHLYY